MLRLYALLASLHTYIGWRLLPDMPYGAVAVLPTLALLVACALLVPSGFARRRRAAGANDQALVWAGMIALGLFSSLFVLTLARDVVLALAWLADDLLDPAWHRALIAASAIGVPVVALAVTAIGFVNARTRARIRDVEVPIDGLPKALDGFTIAQISDLHVGPTIRRDYVQAVVDAVNRIDADVVAVTGDLVDGSVEELAAHTEPLQRLTSRHGVFFVTGNHEYYSGAQAWIAEVARLGMRVLSNEHVVVDHDGARVVVAGVTDYGAHRFDRRQRSDPSAAIAGAPASSVKLLLAHQPLSAYEAARAGFDLQLSGHTHGGQFLPWNWLVRFWQPFTAGLRRLGHLWVYTSRGTGYWGPPKRFGAPSEITRLRLVGA